MTIPNRFELRKRVFDYLKLELTDIAIVDVEHPVSSSSFVLPKIIVTPIRNSLAGKLPNTAAVNSEIQITYYSRDALSLSRPGGIINTVENKMDIFMKTCIMPGYSNGVLIRTIDEDYISKLQSYAAFSVYRFYLGSMT